ncbi:MULTISPECIES: amidase [unclassified Halomonas]|uniref:amidase n=1 Tax=unclassified Halomonas TaxID=2609666 RepID=UPI001C953BDA|nr:MULTISPECIES: amidase [unclassified Halomonas]MBY5927395.1 amidase [Halomonas sp. DP4Y7-2]MBY6234436.1 amidase [Halomonas sp. DP4Y7-1]
MPTAPKSITAFHQNHRGAAASGLDWWHQCVAQIERVEPEVRAWEALATEPPPLDPTLSDRPLFGVPVGIKDIIDTRDHPTAWGTGGYLRSSESLVDASLVSLLKQQGALIMGKTVSTEFAYFTPGKTRNPHDTSRTPGGSSSGSAAAVAAGMVPVAFGTQTAGSMIRPASYCGVYGFKPTFNTLSTAGVRGFAPSLDTIGWFARSVEDVSTVFSSLTGADSIRPASSLKGLRLGVFSLPSATTMSTDVQRVLAEAEAMARHAGAEIVPLALGSDIECLVEEQKVVMAYESARTLASEYAAFADQMGPKLVELIEEGRAIGWSRYRDAMRRAAAARQSLSRVLTTQVDGILAASATGEAPLGIDATGDPLYCRAWTLLGVPCLNLPIGQGSQGMPIGVQLITDRWADEKLLAMAGALVAQASAGQPHALEGIAPV